MTQSIRLTQTVQKGGCAAKISAQDLRTILAKVPAAAAQSQLLVGNGHFDDAAVLLLRPDLALVQTLDFFTPIVDTPRLFGRIAAANSLSDVYAMGGEPICAMGILAFPSATLDLDIASEVLLGAQDVLSEAGVALVGGHSIDDDTLKFGLSVSGTVHPELIWSNDRARPGDALILTKALGTGALTAALKRGAVTESEIGDALRSMCQLNRVLDLLDSNRGGGLSAAVHSATDITGYGLIGHALNMALASRVGFEISAKTLPHLESAKTALTEGFLTKAHKTNRQFAGERVLFSDAVSEIDRLLMFDPQTSGGLLLAVDRHLAPAIVAALKPRFAATSIIGHVGDSGPIRVVE